MEATNSFLIDSTLKEIAKAYTSGTLKWAKRTRPKDWTKLLVQEAMISKTAAEGDLVGLKEALSEYQESISGLCKRFRKENLR